MPVNAPGYRHLLVSFGFLAKAIQMSLTAQQQFVASDSRRRTERIIQAIQCKNFWVGRCRHDQCIPITPGYIDPSPCGDRRCIDISKSSQSKRADWFFPCLGVKSRHDALVMSQKIKVLLHQQGRGHIGSPLSSTPYDGIGAGDISTGIPKPDPHDSAGIVAGANEQYAIAKNGCRHDIGTQSTALP